MKTFKGTAHIDFKLVIPDAFIVSMRDAAQSIDATPFLLQAQANHPTNDEAFIEAVLRNGIRIGLRDKLLGLCAETYIGGTVSPVKLDMHGLVPDHDADTKPQMISLVRKLASEPALRHTPLHPDNDNDMRHTGKAAVEVVSPNMQIIHGKAAAQDAVGEVI